MMLHSEFCIVCNGCLCQMLKANYFCSYQNVAYHLKFHATPIGFHLSTTVDFVNDQSIIRQICDLKRYGEICLP